MSTQFVKDPNDMVQIGQVVHVRIIEIDEMGRINLSMLTAEEEEQAKAQQRERNNDRPMSDQGSRSMHPLSMQFQRENRQQGSGGRPGGYNKRPGYGNKRPFKKFDK